MTTTTEQTKNLQVDEAVFLALVTIDFNGTQVYVVNNTEDILWNGKQYIAFGFTIDEINEEPGQVPSINLSVPNVNRVMEQYVLEYDAMIKQDPSTSPIAVQIDIVNSKALDENIAEATYRLEVGSYSLDDQMAVFELTADNPLSYYFPRNKYRQDICRFQFKGSECGYAGTDNTCQKTFQACKAKEATAQLEWSSANYGGFPSINNEISSYVTI